MAVKGKLGAVVTNANAWVTVCQIAANEEFSTVSLNVLNTGATPADIDIAITTSSGEPSLVDYIDKDRLEQNAVLERLCLVMSPGEKLMVRSTVGAVVCRAYGVGADKQA